MAEPTKCAEPVEQPDPEKTLRELQWISGIVDGLSTHVLDSGYADAVRKKVKQIIRNVRTLLRAPAEHRCLFGGSPRYPTGWTAEDIAKSIANRLPPSPEETEQLENAMKWAARQLHAGSPYPAPNGPFFAPGEK